MTASTAFSIRVDQDALTRIDQAAQREGKTRSAYILSWIPECYDTPTADQPETTETSQNGDNSTAR